MTHSEDVPRDLDKVSNQSPDSEATISLPPTGVADSSRKPFSVLRDRNYWPFFVGNLTSNCGTWFQNIAQALLVYRLTGSTLMVGLVNFAQFIGVWLLISVAGHAADRFDRRKLLISTQLAASAITSGLALLIVLDVVTAPIVIVGAFGVGLCMALLVPASQAFITTLVPRTDLRAAVALHSVTYNLARAVGPPLAAFVVASLGMAWAFLINSFSYLALVAGFLLSRPIRAIPRTRERSSIRSNLQLVSRKRPLKLALIAVAVISFTADPVTTLSPAFAEGPLNEKDTFAGLLVGAFGAGAVIAAFFVTRGSEPGIRRIGLTMVPLAGGIIFLSVAPDSPYAIAGLFVAGFGYLSSLTTCTSLIQMSISEHVRGRVMAIWSVGFLGIRPFAALLDGSLATAFGVRTAAFLMAVPATVYAAALLFEKETRSVPNHQPTDADPPVSDHPSL